MIKKSYVEFPLSVILVANFITRQNTTINLSSSRQGCNSKPSIQLSSHNFTLQISSGTNKEGTAWKPRSVMARYENIIIEISHLNSVCSGWLPAQVFWVRSEKRFLQALRIGWRWRVRDRFVVVVIVLFINLTITKSSDTIQIWKSRAGPFFHPVHDFSIVVIDTGLVCYTGTGRQKFSADDNDLAWRCPGLLWVEGGVRLRLWQTEVREEPLLLSDT